MSRKPDELGRVGNYRLLSVVEERSMLATYLAEHEELGRRALIRTLARTVTPSPRLDEALEHEARTVAKLRHPGVVALYEVVRFEGRIALAFEHPEGATLAELGLTLAPRGGVSVEEAIFLTLGLTDVVRYLHEQGVVHANISTKTVYVTKERGVVLTTFDRALEGASDPRIVRAGLDSAYLSPEELIDEVPTAASDVFALGVVAYELLAGKRPFAAIQEDEGSRSGGPSSAHRVRTERAPPIDASRRVSADLERAVLRALSKQPALRQANAGELLRDFENAVGRTPQSSPTLALLLGRAGLGPKPVSHSREKDSSSPGHDVRPPRRAFDVAIRLAGVLVAMVVLVVAIEVVERAGRPASSIVTATSAPGYVRVLAHPWAEVWIDGVATDTTPLAKPIELLAGRHTLVFKHPRASDERRVVDLSAGEVLTVSVDMHVIAPPVDAGIDASP